MDKNNIELSQVVNRVNNWNAMHNAELDFDIATLDAAISFIIANTEDEKSQELASFEVLRGLQAIKDKLDEFRNVTDVEPAIEE